MASLPWLAAVQALRAAAVAVRTDAADASHSRADSIDVEALLHELVAACNELARSAQILAEKPCAGVDLPSGWATGDLSEPFGPGATGPALYPASAYGLSALTSEPVEVTALTVTAFRACKAVRDGVA